MNYIGVDLGGTSIKAGVVTDDGRILSKDKVKTLPKRHYSEIIKDMAMLIKKVMADASLTQEEVEGVGIGVPGTSDNEKGMILFCTNLFFKNVPIQKELDKYLQLKVYLENDANVAALAESEFGASKDVADSVLLTLGTGVGGGIIINNQIYSGFNHAGSELGHLIIMHNGLECTCGSYGCLERYASASALVAQTIEAAKKNPASIINDLVDNDYTKVSAKTVFEAQKLQDQTADEVIEQYIDYLSTGVASIISVLFPEYIIIGGGLGNEGENLLVPLRVAVAKKAYSSEGIAPTKILPATMGNSAGIVGAAMLVKHNKQEK